MINPISIINQTSDLSAFGIYLAFGSAITHAALALILRKIGKTEHPATTALIHNLVRLALGAKLGKVKSPMDAPNARS